MKTYLEIVDILMTMLRRIRFWIALIRKRSVLVVREEIAKEIRKDWFLTKTEIHLNKVELQKELKQLSNLSLSDQWFLKMEDLKAFSHSICSVDGDIKLHPARFNNTYAHWLNKYLRLEYFTTRTTNSRLLLWRSKRSDFVAKENIEEGAKQHRKKTSNFSLSFLTPTRCVDALDTLVSLFGCGQCRFWRNYGS
jgi:valyl-tRNA synthetase